MAVSIVNKSVFQNTLGGFQNTNLTLNAPTTIGNTLVVIVFFEQVPGGSPAVKTDSGALFNNNIYTQIAGFPNYNTVASINYLIPATSVSYIQLLQVAVNFDFMGVVYNQYPSVIAYELTPANLTWLHGGTSTATNASSLAGISMPGGPGAASTFYITVCATGRTHTSGAVVSGVSPGSWSLDTLETWGMDNVSGTYSFTGGVGTLIATGTQQPTFTINEIENSGTTSAQFYGTSLLVSTTTVLTSNIDPSDLGQLVTFTAVVNGPGGSGSPTGTVTFGIDGHQFVPVAVSAVSTGISQAQYSTASLALGNHQISASYSGDTAYLPSIATPITQIVIQPCAFPFGFALQELANRLYDSTMQFWSQAELTYYIQEAFRTWNALTSYWRGDFTLQSSQGTVFYDITNSITAPNSLRLHNITDVYLYNIIEYHLLEPVVGAGPWTGSLQFSLDDILNAVQRRQNEILSVTGCAYSHYTVNAAPDRIYMLNTTLDLRRVAYIPETAALGTATPLFEDDTWGIQAFSPLYTTEPPGVPSTYRKSTEPLLSFDADVPPLPGTYDLITIESGPVLSLAVTSTFTIPDDWTWVLKWGALADLLGRESNAKDLPRAKYCEGRYKQGLQLLAAASAVLAVRYNNLPLQVDAVKSADLFNPTWQGAAQGPPSEALTAGLNLVALSPPPDAGPYSLTATVVENAPVPVATTDCLQLTQDVFDVILDYAQHLAAFKMGGEEFQMTEPLLQRFMQMAALYSSKLSEQGEFTKILYAISQDEQNMNPRYTADGDPATGGDQ